MDTKDLDQKLKSVLEDLKQEFSGLRADRPATQIVEDIQVDYAGQLLKIK